MKKPLIVIATSILVAIILVVYGLYFIPQPDISLYKTTAVQKMNLTQTVSASGTVTAATEDDLGFQTQGQIATITVAVGDTVKKGQILATLNQSNLDAALGWPAQANLDIAKIGLQKVVTATTSNTSSDIQTSIDNSRSTLLNQLTESRVTLDTALSTYIDQMFLSPRSSNPIFGFTTSTNSNTYFTAPTTLAWKINNERALITSEMETWSADLNTISTTTDSQNIISFYHTAETTLQEAQTLLSDISNAFTISSIPTTASQAPLLSYESGLATARSNISTAINSLQTAEQSFLTAQTSTGQYAVASQNAAVAATANVAAITTQLNQTVLTAPVNGTITGQTGNVGEIIGANTPFIHLISDTLYQMDVYVSESSIGLISLGQDAQVILDPYGPENPFPATVTTIDPGPTTINGVTMYKITLQFNQNDSRIKDGMTGNAIITVNQENQVLAVPKSAILQNNGVTTVLLRRPHSLTSQLVTTGMVGSNGWVEIKNGIVAGDRVATFGIQ